MAEDKCWFCQSSVRMTQSHVLLHCPSARLRAGQSEGVGREGPWRCEGVAGQSQMGTAPGEVPRAVGEGLWQTGRTRMGPMPREWMSEWYGRRWKGQPLGMRADGVVLLCFPFPYNHSFVRPRDLRTAHCRGRRISFCTFCSNLPTEGRRLVSFVFPRPHIPWGWMASSRESNKNKIRSAYC
jgi:hypothetical protein